MNESGVPSARAPLHRFTAGLAGLPLVIAGCQLASLPPVFFVLFLLGAAIAMTAVFGGAKKIIPSSRIARCLDALAFGWIDAAAKLDSLTKPRW